MDLKGQLSNPRENLETLTPQGSRANQRRRARPSNAVLGASSDAESGPKQEVGRYSNPSSSGSERQAQRRLKPAEVDELLVAYGSGELVHEIAARFGVSRTTVIGHVTRQGARHRRDCDWTPEELAAAARLYAEGRSLAEVGRRFGVDKSTVSNRFRRAGLPVRARRGWE